MGWFRRRERVRPRSERLAEAAEILGEYQRRVEAGEIRGEQARAEAREVMNRARNIMGDF